MQSSENKKTVKFVNDINVHIHAIKLAIDTLQLQYTTEVEIFVLCSKLLERLVFVEKIIQLERLQLPITISCKVNELFILDKNLSIVNLQIINGKRHFNPTAIASLKFTS